MGLSPGKRLDHYEILSLLGAGSHTHPDVDGTAGGYAPTRAVNHAQLRLADLLTALSRSRHFGRSESGSTPEIGSLGEARRSHIPR